MRLLLERRWRTASAQATKQIQQRPITITPTSTVSSLLFEESSGKVKKRRLKGCTKERKSQTWENLLSEPQHSFYGFQANQRNIVCYFLVFIVVAVDMKM